MACSRLILLVYRFKRVCQNSFNTQEAGYLLIKMNVFTVPLSNWLYIWPYRNQWKYLQFNWYTCRILGISMADILAVEISVACSWTILLVFRFRFHWNSFRPGQFKASWFDSSRNYKADKPPSVPFMTYLSDAYMRPQWVNSSPCRQNGCHCVRRQFQMHVVECTWYISDSNFTEICSHESSWQ